MRFFFAVALMLFSGWALFPQTLKISYSFEYKTTSHSGWNRDLSLCVEIDSLGVFCYSENNYLRDSIRYKILDEGLGPYVAAEEGKRFPRGVNWCVAGDPSIGKFTHYDYLALLIFIAEGNYQSPQWEIGAETEEVCGHTCRKAVAEYYGRTWIVWYTEELPVGLGPWLLWGTPGMILKAEDGQSLFRFTCETVRVVDYSRRASVIAYMNERSNDPAATIIAGSMMEVEALRTKYNRNVDASYGAMGLQLQGFTADGKPKEIPKYRSYIPLIPDEYWK